MKSFPKLVFFFALVLSTNSSLVAQETRAKRLTKGSYDIYPSVSVKSGLVAFVRATTLDESSGASGNLWLLDVDSMHLFRAGTRKILEQYDGYPCWSSDSKSIFFSSQDQIMRLEWKERRLSILARDSSASLLAPSLSPDGSMLAFWSYYTDANRIPKQRICIYSLHDGTIRKLSPLDHYALEEFPWSAPVWLNNQEIVACAPIEHPSKIPEDPGWSIDLFLFSHGKETYHTIDTRMFSTFYKVSGNKVYYTKIIDGNHDELLSYDFSSNTKSVLAKDVMGVFDVSTPGEEVVFARRDSLWLVDGENVEKPLDLQGSNPVWFSHDQIIFERSYDRGRSIENSLYMTKLR